MTGLLTVLGSWLPPGLSFRDPAAFWLLLAVPLAILFRVARERRGEGALTVPTLAAAPIRCPAPTIITPPMDGGMLPYMPA